jgi:hypothetical protein
MTTEQLMNALLRPSFNWRMARAKNPNPNGTYIQKGAYTTMVRAEKEINDLLRQWEDPNG